MIVKPHLLNVLCHCPNCSSAFKTLNSVQREWRFNLLNITLGCCPHLYSTVVPRRQADLVRRGDGWAGVPWCPWRRQRVPVVLSTGRRCGHLHSWTLAALLSVGHPGLQKLLPVPVWHMHATHTHAHKYTHTRAHGTHMYVTHTHGTRAHGTRAHGTHMHGQHTSKPYVS